MAQANQHWPVPRINVEICTGCGLCVEVCPKRALEMAGNTARVAHPDRCDYSGLCERICPVQAIERPFQIVTLDETGD